MREIAHAIMTKNAVSQVIENIAAPSSSLSNYLNFGVSPHTMTKFATSNHGKVTTENSSILKSD